MSEARDVVDELLEKCDDQHTACVYQRAAQEIRRLRGPGGFLWEYRMTLGLAIGIAIGLLCGFVNGLSVHAIK